MPQRSTVPELSSAPDGPWPVAGPWPDGARLAEAWQLLLVRLAARHAEVGALREQLAGDLGLSRPGLDAAVDAMVASVASPGCLERLARGARPAGSPALVLLSATPPLLALQMLWAALAARRPVIFKTSWHEQAATPLLIAQLAALLPELAPRLAAAYWPGDDLARNDAAFAAAGRVVVYGRAATQAAVAARVPAAKMLGLGPKISAAIVDRGVGDAAGLAGVAAGLAADAALLDQRGCLSLQAVVTLGDPAVLAAALAVALRVAAARWPPGRADAASLAEARLARDEAQLAGLEVADMPLAAGGVIVERAGAPICPSPGLRQLRVYPAADAASALEMLRPWASHLQGVALAGGGLEGIERTLERWGVSWICEPGRLQVPDMATWRNGGVDAVDWLSESPR